MIKIYDPTRFFQDKMMEEADRLTNQLRSSMGIEYGVKDLLFFLRNRACYECRTAFSEIIDFKMKTKLKSQIRLPPVCVENNDWKRFLKPVPVTLSIGGVEVGTYDSFDSIDSIQHLISDPERLNSIWDQISDAPKHLISDAEEEIYYCPKEGVFLCKDCQVKHKDHSCATIDKFKVGDLWDGLTSRYDAKFKIKTLSDEGKSYFKEGNITAAMEQFKKVLKIDRKSYSALINLGLCYTKLEDYKKAGKYYNKAMKCAPTSILKAEAKSTLRLLKILLKIPNKI